MATKPPRKQYHWLNETNNGSAHELYISVHFVPPPSSVKNVKLSNSRFCHDCEGMMVNFTSMLFTVLLLMDSSFVTYKVIITMMRTYTLKLRFCCHCHCCCLSSEITFSSVKRTYNNLLTWSVRTLQGNLRPRHLGLDELTSPSLRQYIKASARDFPVMASLSVNE